MLSIATVCGRSALGGKGSLGGYSRVLKRVLMSVDLPRPDSPAMGTCQVSVPLSYVTTTLTDNHSSKLEALPYTLPMHLVRKVGKTDITVELFANDRRRGFRGLGKGRARAVRPARAIGSERIAVGGRNV